MTTAAHRAPRLTLGELAARATCWLFGHDVHRTGIRSVVCHRCERVAPTPVELP